MATFVIPMFGAIVASYTDLKDGLIKNWLTVPLFLSGILYYLITGGAKGFSEALITSICCSALAWMYAPAVGGGDVKLSMGVGAWIGLGNLWTFFFGVGIVRVLFGFLLRYKVYGPGMTAFLRGIWIELSMFPAPFTPGEKKGLPGAVAVLGGVVAVMAIRILEKGA